MVAVTITASCQSLRRTLGPTAWVVLEEVVCAADREGDGWLLARTNVRQLAVNLGLSKDTVARALSRLRDAGIVRHGLGPRSEFGRFGPCEYRISGAAVSLLLGASPVSTRTAKPMAPRRSQAKAELQATLFDNADGGAT